MANTIRRVTRFVGLLALAVALLPAAHAAVTIVEIPTLGGPSSGALGLNNLGQVVGVATVPETEPLGYPHYEHAVLWSPQTGLTDLHALSDYEYSSAADINDNGQIVGYYHSSTPLPVQDRAFRIDTSTNTTMLFEPLGGTKSRGTAINAVGDIAGWASNATLGNLACLRVNGVWQEVPGVGTRDAIANGINDLGDTVGARLVPTSNLHRAFIKPADGPMVQLGTFGGDESFATALNNLGQVVGYAEDSIGIDRAFLYDAGVMTALTRPFGYSSCVANAINEQGQIVGSVRTAAGLQLAALWEGDECTLLYTLLGRDSDWILISASDINEAGQICGTGLYQGHVRGFVLTIPEPAAAAVLALAAVLGCRRRG